MDLKELAKIPDMSRSEFIWKYLRQNASSGNKIAQIFADDGTSRTYKELYQDSVYVAEGIKLMGIESGDILAIVSRNSHELFPIFFGSVMAGVVTAASVVELNASELRSNFTVAKPKVIVTTKAKRPAVEEAVRGLDPEPKVYEVVEFFKEAVSKGSQTDLENFRPFKVLDYKTHVFAIIYSSGTTGVQKAVARTDNIRGIFAYGTIHKEEGPFLFLSQPNAAAWHLSVLCSLLQNRTLIFMDNLDAGNVANAIHKYKPAFWNGAHIDNVVFLRDLLKRNPNKWDISSLISIECLGDVLPADVHRDLYEFFGIPIYNYYGATEMGLVFQADLNLPPVFGSIGTPIPKIKLVDPDTREEIKEPNRPGELLVHGVNANYLNNAEATKNAYDQDGWYKTGDLLYFDEHGHYFAVSRLKEVFKCLTYQVAPQEIETHIRLIPGVAQVVVVGKRGDITIGELPTAFVVRAPNSSITEKDILDYLEKLNLHDSKRLRGGVRFVDDLPRNANHKILRRKVQEMADNE